METIGNDDRLDATVIQPVEDWTLQTTNQPAGILSPDSQPWKDSTAFTHHRIGLLVACNTQIFDLFTKNNMITTITSEQKAQELMRELRTARPMDEQQKKKSKVRSAEEDDFGVRRVFELPKKDIYGSLFQWYMDTRPDKRCIVPNTRQEIIL